MSKAYYEKLFTSLGSCVGTKYTRKKSIKELKNYVMNSYIVPSNNKCRNVAMKQKKGVTDTKLYET